jgi:hypothetical protein
LAHLGVEFIQCALKLVTDPGEEKVWTPTKLASIPTVSNAANERMLGLLTNRSGTKCPSSFHE